MDDRTCKSDWYWENEDAERLGGQTQPFAFEADPALVDAIHLAMRAGACRAMARFEPDRALAWNALAEAERRKCSEALRGFTATQRGE